MAATALQRALSGLGTQTQIVGLKDSEAADPFSMLGIKLHSTWFPRAFGFAPSLMSSILDFGPDVTDVQGLWTYPSLANLRYHRRTGIPYIITPHGMLDPWARARSVKKKRLVRFLFEDEHLRHASCLRATAEMEAEHFRNSGLKNPIAIVPNGVVAPALIQSDRPPSASRRLLFLSRIHPKKGLPLLLRAWARLSHQNPGWELVIAGPDEVGHRAEMQILSGDLGLPRVQWLDHVDGDQKSALYRSADLFVLPTHAENFGLVIAEALAHGIPVITTRNAPWEGIGAHRCGWWIDLKEDALVDTLAHAMSCSPGELRAMGARGHDWISRDYSWDRVAAQMLDVYLWVRARGAPPPTVHL